MVEVELGNSGQNFVRAIITVPHALSRGRSSDGRGFGSTLGMVLQEDSMNGFTR